MDILENRANIKLKYLSGNTDSPDVADGAPLKIFSSNLTDTVSKNINYIVIPKAGEDKWKEGSEVKALDLLEEENTWSIEGFVYHDKDGKYSLPSVFRDNNDDGVVNSQNISFNAFGDRSSIVTLDDGSDIIIVNDDVTDEISANDTIDVFGTTSNNGEYTVSSISYDSANNETDITVSGSISAETSGSSDYIKWSNSHEWHTLGATKIKKGSVTVKDSQSNTLTEGVDYNIDYNKGMIEVFNSGNINVTTTPDGIPDETLTISYNYQGRNDNIARTVKKMAQRGGNIVLEYDLDTYTQESRSIQAVDTSNDFFSVSGFVESDYNKGDEVVVSDSTANDGTYIVDQVVYDSATDETDVYVGSNVSDSTADGKLTKKEGSKIMVQADTIEVVQNPSNPEQAQIRIDIREALDRAV